MTIRVIVAPEPIVQPAQLGEFSASPFAEGVIASVTAEFDGPLGQLGRCFGPQTIEYTTRCLAGCQTSLPCGPVIELVDVVRLCGADEVAIDASAYHLSGSGVVWSPVPDGFVRIRYRAGYEEGKTGPIPLQVCQAIILKSRLLLTMLDKSAFVRSSEVEGVGKWEYSVPEQVSAVIDKAVGSLVAGLKVYRV